MAREMRVEWPDFGIARGVHHVAAPYCYRCRFSYPECEIDCAAELEIIVECLGEDNVAVFIYETILGGGGAIIPPKEYHERVRRICSSHRIPLILDEVFAGMGRRGKMFAYQNWNTEPDILVLRKGLGGGFPIGAVVATERVSGSLKKGDQGGTFSANPLTCAAAVASIKLIRKEGLPERSSKIGSMMIRQFLDMKQSGILRGDVRGLGLSIGLELVKDERTKIPDSALTTRLEKELVERGVLVGIGGPYKNVIRINPPLTITESEATRVVGAIQECLLPR
jgi:4-aminobutyrate aminotransferase-like enzyme